MNEPANIAKVCAALVAAQKQFGPALKASINPHFKSRYADLSACVEAVIDALNANGIALVQRTTDCETGVCVETVFVHESGEMLACGALRVPAPKQDPQGYGSALTYARRYSLMAACGIAPEDDDGEDAVGRKSNGGKVTTVPTESAAPQGISKAKQEAHELLMKWAPEKRDAVVQKASRFPKDKDKPKGPHMQLDSVEALMRASDKWAGSTLGKLREMVAAQERAEPTHDEAPEPDWGADNELPLTPPR